MKTAFHGKHLTEIESEEEKKKHNFYDLHVTLFVIHRSISQKYFLYILNKITKTQATKKIFLINVCVFHLTLATESHSQSVSVLNFTHRYPNEMKIYIQQKRMKKIKINMKKQKLT